MIKKNNKKKAFTLIEALATLIIVGTIAIAGVAVMRPGDIKKDAYKKAGMDTLIRISIATKTIVSYNSPKHDMTLLKNTSGTEFALASDTNRHLYLSQLYSENLGTKASSSVNTTYTGTSLKNESGSAVGSLKISNFNNGIFIKNGTYMAFKLTLTALQPSQTRFMILQKQHTPLQTAAV